MSPAWGPIPHQRTIRQDLEGHTQGHLNLARPTGDIDDLAELRISHGSYRITETAPVEDVKHVGSDLDELALPEWEAFEDAEVLRWLIRPPEVAEVARRSAYMRHHAIRCRWGIRERLDRKSTRLNSSHLG